MRKKLFLKYFLLVFFNIGFCFLFGSKKNQLGVSAQVVENKEKSPNQSCSIYQFMFNAGSTGFPLCPCEIITGVELNLTDEKINCTFDHLPKAARLENQKERIFAVLIDSKKGPVDFQFLDENLKCTLTPSYHSDYLEIHLYMQNEGEPNFLLHEENFLCKTKFLPASENLFYEKYTPNVVISYYPNNEEKYPDDVSKRGSIWQKITPNTYSFGEFVGINDDTIAFLEFPNGEHKEMSYEDLIVPMSTFTTTAKDEEETIDGKKHVMPSGKKYYTFRVPEDVNEFNIRFYINSIDTEYGGKDRMFDYHVVKFKKK